MSIDRMPSQGSDFPDVVKLEARKRAGFKCCYCREHMGDDVHHIQPKEEVAKGFWKTRFCCARNVIATTATGETSVCSYGKPVMTGMRLWRGDTTRLAPQLK